MKATIIRTAEGCDFKKMIDYFGIACDDINLIESITIQLKINEPILIITGSFILEDEPFIGPDR